MPSPAAAAGLGAATARKLQLFNPLIFLALVGERETLTTCRAPLHPAAALPAVQPSTLGFPWRAESHSRLQGFSLAPVCP